MKTTEKSYLFLLPFAGATLAGCLATTHTSSILPPLEHPLFHRETQVFSTSKKSITLTFRKERTDSRCVMTFMHPVLNHCESDLPGTFSRTPNQSQRFSYGSPPRLRIALVDRARTMMDKPDTATQQGRFKSDCSGFVLSVFAAEGVPLLDWFPVGTSVSNVAALYRAAESHGEIHTRATPEVGDLVFFDNTYDRNGDGKPNDPLTHVGIVERVDEDGTVSIIHHSQGGILRYRMNREYSHIRRDPKTHKVLNHYLRLASPGARKAKKRLTAELFRAYATIAR
jgi:hypothetical protein